MCSSEVTQVTKEELIHRMKALITGDTEADHANADELLLQYINVPEVTELFDNIWSWYA